MNDQNPSVDIRALAKLARIDIVDDEVATLEKEIPGILALVEQIQQVSAEMPKAQAPGNRNVMRADDGAHETGVYTETLLSAAPGRIGDQVAVKQVISRQSSPGGK